MRVYRPLIGKRLEALIWMPLACDTPGVADDLGLPAFSFTGGAFLAFEGEGLFLSWAQIGQNMVLALGQDARWGRHTLDRVRASRMPPWIDLEDTTLRRVELFSTSFIDDRKVVGARHVMSRDGTDFHFWIGTGGADFIGDHDDLWVGAGVEPPNLAALIPVGVVAP